MLRDLIAAFCDEERAGVAEKLDGLDFILFCHERDWLSNQLHALINQVVQKVVDVLGDAVRAFFLSLVGV